MQTQFDSSNLVAKPMVLGGQTPSVPIDHAPASRESVQSKVALIDWNTCRPNGTAAARQAAVEQIAVAFRGNVFVGIQSSAGTLELTTTEPVDDAGKRAVCRSAATEAMHSSKSCSFASAAGQTSLVLQQLRETSGAALALSFGALDAQASDPTPAGSHAKIAFGVVVSVPSESQLQTKEEYATLIAKTQQQFQLWLQTWQLCRVGASVNRWQARWNYFRGRKGKLALAAALACCMCLAIPLPYLPQRACIVEPASKTFVASPIDGRIRAASVRPGDSVKQGQLLARLDDEQVLRSLSAAEAEYEAAGKRRDSALATRAAGEMRLAQLEQERIALEIESLQSQLERLELRCPTDGIVVQGDWFQSDGAPVERGDVLFEIAPMDKMRVEIHLSTDDLARIKVDDLATIRVDAAPGEKWSANLERIDPRGQVIDSEVVFVANMEVPNNSNHLRPGMKGTTRISAGTQTIGWLLFHRPAMWLMKKLAW